MTTSSVARHTIMSGFQKEQGTTFNREEEYLRAQRAAVESVQIGRETLEQATRQGEQLDRAASVADETEYKLDKAGRILRGMTWSGWVANMFTGDVKPPSELDAIRKAHRRPSSPPAVYENIPDACSAAAQSLQNYHANVKVLETCQTAEQKETCTVICNAMYDVATAKMQALVSKANVEAYVLEFQSHLAIMRERQQRCDPSRSYLIETASPRYSASKSVQGTSPFLDKAAATLPMTNDPVLQMQDRHLLIMSESLGELGLIAKSLNHVVEQQAQTIDSLDSRTDTVVEKSKMVTRRADRLIQKRSWTPTKPTFACVVSVRHMATGRYLAVVKGNLFLVPTIHKETAVFGLWKRQGEIFGLQSKDSRRWIGQNIFGALACTSDTFGRREEWEADTDWKSTRFLCASAGWGAGGYLLVRPNDLAISIGGSGVEEREKADLWCMQEYTGE
jgi:hypothetical protein